MTRSLAPASFAIFARLLREGSGMSIREDKIYLLFNRLAPMLLRLALPDLDALARRLAQAGQATLGREVIEAMTTNESQFFRDKRPFTHLRDEALPRLRSARAPGTAIRLWSAGASSGQEAYSIAMIAAARDASASSDRLQIIATDIARGPLARARAGRFSDFEISRGLPLDLRARHFRADAEGWLIDDELRRAVVFQEHNLLAHPAPLGRFDVVFCRNVLIYFDPITRRGVLDGIADQLASDGLLYLGCGETLVGVTERFYEIPGERGIYKRDGRAKSTEAASRGHRPETGHPPAAHADIPVEPIDRRVAVARNEAQFFA